MAEFLVRLVFEIVVLGLLRFAERLCQGVARAVVPVLTGGRVLVEPVKWVVVERRHGLHRLTDGTPVVGPRLASLLGLLLLALALVIALIVIRQL